MAMVDTLEIMEYWAPEEVRPGNIYFLEDACESGDENDPYVAALACPECGSHGLITRKQVAGLIPVMCGSNTCPAQFFLRGEKIVPRKTF